MSERSDFEVVRHALMYYAAGQDLGPTSAAQRIAGEAALTRLSERMEKLERVAEAAVEARDTGFRAPLWDALAAFADDAEEEK